MNKKKSQEYLDKINESFEALSNNPHDIDVDSLLGYIRIFYSSVKSIPVQTKIEGNKKSSSMNYPIHDSQPLIPKESTIVENKTLDIEPEHIIEEKIEEEFLPDSNDNEIAEEISIPLNDDNFENETIKNQFQEIKATDVQEVTASKTEVKEVQNPGDGEVQNPEEIIEPKQVVEEILEIITVLPQAEKEEIAIHQTNDYTAEKNVDIIEEAPTVKPDVILELPNIKDDSKYGSKVNILSQIETEQHKPLYTPNNQSSHNPSDAIESLFKDKSPTGLVDFLGLSPLDNINKAWGLNEKMLVIKDLFGNDFNAFNETIEMINKFTSFEEVKNYLINNVVHKFSWNDISKFKKATDFIVQTKRLFVK